MPHPARGRRADARRARARTPARSSPRAAPRQSGGPRVDPERTMSFSVVRITSAPDDFAARADLFDLAALNNDDDRRTTGARSASSRPFRDRRRSARASRCPQTRTPVDRAQGRPRRRENVKVRFDRAGRVWPFSRRCSDGTDSAVSTSSASAADAASSGSRSRPNGSVRVPSDASGATSRSTSRIEIEMLKAVVQHVHRASEPALGDSPGNVAARRHQHRGARNGARQHLRLVARSLDVGKHAAAVADDHHTFVDDFSRIAAAQNRRALSHLEQHPRDLGRQRRLAAAADGEIPDADDRRGETAPQMGPALVVAPACARELAVKKVQQTLN